MIDCTLSAFETFEGAGQIQRLTVRHWVIEEFRRTADLLARVAR